MRPIPQKLRDEMVSDPFYQRCCLDTYNMHNHLKGVGGQCEGRIEWHHNLIVAGRQLNTHWAILPLCHLHHDKLNSQTKEVLNWIMLNRATEQELSEVSKAVNYKGLRDRLNKVYGKYN